jgi:hypothetical protein
VLTVAIYLDDDVIVIAHGIEEAGLYAPPDSQIDRQGEDGKACGGSQFSRCIGRGVVNHYRIVPLLTNFVKKLRKALFLVVRRNDK